MQVDTPEELWRVVDQAVPEILQSKQVRLFIIDSVGALYRTVAEESDGARASAHGQRAQHLMRLAARLKQLSDKFNVAVVVTNQVSDKPLDARRRRIAAPWERGSCSLPDGSARVPALGMAWAHVFVAHEHAWRTNTRLVLTRHHQIRTTHADADHRQLDGDEHSKCEGSSWHRQRCTWPGRRACRSALPVRTASFELSARGLVGVM